MKITAQPGLAHATFSQIKGLYTIKRELRERLKDNKINAEEFTEQRRERCGPMLKAFHEWLEENAGVVQESSKIGDSIRYALKEWPGLER
jgi:hypothetical protein